MFKYLYRVVLLDDEKNIIKKHRFQNMETTPIQHLFYINNLMKTKYKNNNWYIEYKTINN